MRNSRPLLTIGIPTYNSAHFLQDSVGSVLRQGLDSYEIVIIDNASEDNTEEVVRSFGDDRIRYFRNETNLGSRANHNRCLEEARGVYFKFLSADDALVDGILPKQMSVLTLRPDVTLVSCNMSVTDASLHDGKIYSFFPGEHSGMRVINLCLSRLGNCIGGPSAFMFRLADAKGLSMDPDYRYISDLKFGLQLLQRGNYVNIDQIGYLYRRHAASDTEMNCPAEIREFEFFRLAKEFNWWNLVTCVQAIRRGGKLGRKAAWRNWRTVLTLHSVLNAIVAVSDIVRLRGSNVR